MDIIQEPSKQISKKAITVWRIRSTISLLVTLIIGGVLIFLSNFFDWYNWITYIIYAVIALIVLSELFNIIIKPIYLQRTWRYEIAHDSIQLKSGFIFRTHIIIPMSRVEYVNTDQGPLLRNFNLSAILIGTISSSHEIPALEEEEAKELRQQIIYYANIDTNEDNNDLLNKQTDAIPTKDADSNKENASVYFTEQQEESAEKDTRYSFDDADLEEVFEENSTKETDDRHG